MEVLINLNYREELTGTLESPQFFAFDRVIIISNNFSAVITPYVFYLIKFK